MLGKAGVALGLILLAACSKTTPTAQPPAPTAAPARTENSSLSTSPTAAAQSTGLGGPDRSPPSPIIRNADGQLEVQGTATRDHVLWGLLFRSDPTLRANDEIKIVWRMTGRGPIQLTAIAPNGAQTPLAWGPEPHAVSNYHRPGEEWGAGYRFTQAGCWHLRATRDDAAADIWLTVA